MSLKNSVEIDPVKKSIETDKQLQSRNRGSKTLKIGAILGESANVIVDPTWSQNSSKNKTQGSISDWLRH